MENQEKLAESYYWRGMSYRQGGNENLAVGCFEKAAELGYNPVDVYMDLGYSYRGQADQLGADGYSEDAESLYLKAAECFGKVTDLIEAEESE